MDISVIIPVYNGEKSLFELNKRLADVLKNNFEIIYVDDFSNDNSRKIIRQIAYEDQRIKYIFFDKNYGQQAAIFAGLKKSRGEIVLTLDDDLQHRPEDIPILTACLDDFEGVFAFPFEKPHSRYRKWGSHFTDQLFNVLFKKEKTLKISSFRAIKRDLVDRMLLSQAHFVYISALMIKESNKLKTIYNDQLHRKYGNSNYNLLKLMKLYLNIIIYYGEIKIMQRNKPLFIVEEEI
ncbi:MAG: glycosyltransferase family 2 protein [Clostridiales bacterium]|nr:glycosyltransferase family 2 protein [Clostridiales bacterium]